MEPIKGFNVEERIEAMLHNDELWDLFREQLKSRGDPLFDSVDRMKGELLNGELSEQELYFLREAYKRCMIFICDDHCDYNPRNRRGMRKFTRPKRFYCNRGHVGESVKQGSTKPLEWLNVEKNLCTHYYIDITKN